MPFYLLYTGNCFFAISLQKKPEKINEDFLRGRAVGRAPPLQGSGKLHPDSPGLQRKIRVVVIWFFDGGAAGDAAEGVVAEAAAAVVAGDDAAELADHRFIVNFPRELAIRTVAVDLFSEQHGAAAFLLCLPPLYTLSAQIAMVLFAKQQKTSRAEKQRHRPRRL